MKEFDPKQESEGLGDTIAKFTNANNGSFSYDLLLSFAYPFSRNYANGICDGDTCYICAAPSFLRNIQRSKCN